MEITKERFFIAVFILLILVVLFKEYYTDLYETENDDCPKEKIDAEIKKIVKKNQKKITEKMIMSCKDGLIRGSVAGCLTGGLPGAITGGVIYGVSNIIVTYIMSELDEEK